MKLINWDKVDYRVKAYDLRYVKMDTRYNGESTRRRIKYLDGTITEQPKAWEIYFTLIFMIVIYTTFAISLNLYILYTDSWLFLIPAVGMFMSIFMAEYDKYFTLWIRVPLVLYYLFLLLYIIFTLGVN